MIPASPPQTPPSLHLGWWVTVVLFLLLFVLPVERYRPACDRWHESPFIGPMRGVFADYLAASLEQDGFLYIRVGDEIYVRFLQLDRIIARKLFVVRMSYVELSEFQINVEHRLVDAILEGRGAARKPIDAPPALIDAHTARRIHDNIVPPNYEAVYGHYPPKRRDSVWGCEVYQAAMIAVEDIPPEQRLRLPPRREGE